jgi:transposase InsO family protein
MKKADETLCIRHACSLFDIPLSTYYDCINRPEFTEEESKIMNNIIKISSETYHTYGSRRMRDALNDEGTTIGRFKTRRLMKAAGIKVVYPKKKHRYPPDELSNKAPELLHRQFNPTRINTHWVGDITYIRTHHGWSYLACVLDLATREVVGYALSKSPDAQLAKDALMNAIRKHNPDTTKLIFHSDQGVQYSAKTFTNTLKILKITQSMSRRGNCWDNAVMERFFRSLKGERLDYLSFINHDAVVPVVESYIRFYNYKRISSVLNYQTPAKHREILKKAA